MTIGRQETREERGAIGGEPGTIGVEGLDVTEAGGKVRGAGDRGVRVLQIAALGLAVSLAAFGARVEACPWHETDALWQKAACDLQPDQAKFLGTLSRVRTVYSGLAEEDQNFLALAGAASAQDFSLAADPAAWLGAPVNFLSMSTISGILEDREFSDREMDAYTSLLSGSGTVDFGKVLELLSEIAENRGGRILVLRRFENFIHVVAVRPEVFCRWSDVRLEEFLLLGTISEVGKDGSFGPVDWTDSPRSCPEPVG